MRVNMTDLSYCENFDEARTRLRIWWHDGDIGRPALLITVPRTTPMEDIPALPVPPGWSTDDSAADFDYRVNLGLKSCINTHFLGENIPHYSPNLGPNSLALYLGCRAVDGQGTVWFEPCISDPDQARFDFSKDNFYWRFSIRLAKELLKTVRGKMLLEFPDLIEGLDTLAAMRGTQVMLTDLLERPDWVRQALRQITDRYFHCYDIWYNLISDETGGSVFWVWGPGRMAKFQCDCSAMISADMFGEFMVPVLAEMCERVSYSIYHWDGPGALQHHDHLLSIPSLKVLQWTPGEGVEPAWHKRWWPIYHKTLEAGKKLFIFCGEGEDTEILKAMKKEFKNSFHRFLLYLSPKNIETAQAILKIVES